jgi:hypothetical protein
VKTQENEMTITFSAEERSDKTGYIHEALAQGYTRMLKPPLHLLSDEQLRDEHGKAWEFFNMGGKAGSGGVKHDHACTNCFADQGPCLGECAVSEENAQCQKGFEEAAKPLIKWLAENVHPHHTAIVTSNSAELLEGSMSFPTNEFLKD